MDSSNQLQTILSELRSENMRLRSALHGNLTELLALRKSMPETEALNRCIMELRIALAE